MTIPGFTAETTLAKTREEYIATNQESDYWNSQNVLLQLRMAEVPWHIVHSTVCYYSCVGATGEWGNCGHWCGTV